CSEYRAITRRLLRGRARGGCTCVPPWSRVLDASRPAASSTKRLTMEQSPPPDPEIVGWLTTLGVTSLCQWDVLVFLYRHHTTLLGAEDLARLLGYTSHTIVLALAGLETQELG